MTTAHQRAGLAVAFTMNHDFSDNESFDLDDNKRNRNNGDRRGSYAKDRQLKKYNTENSSYFSSAASEDILMDNSQQSSVETIEEMTLLDKTPVGTRYSLDTVLYQVENRISSNPSFPFLFLAGVFCLVINLFGYLWYLASNNINVEGGGDPLYGSVNLGDAWFLSIQLLTSAGFDDSIPNHGFLRPLYFLQIFVGLVIFAILVGFVTDTIQGFMKSLSDGKTRVMEERHTLILGWNDTTLLVLIQLARLREQYQIYTRRGINRFIPLKFIRDRSSTTTASRDIVLLNDQLAKDDMHEIIEEMLRQHNFHWHTKLGQNIVCRVGDPRRIPDLLRAGAHKASSIITMLTDRDKNERLESDGESINSSTLRTVLCLRRILFSVDVDFGTSHNYSKKSLSNDTRIVIQLEQPSRLMDTITFRNQDAGTVVYPLDLSMFLNSLMFNCVSQPRLAEVLSNILSFEGNSMHARRVGEVCRKVIKTNNNDKTTKTFLKFGDLSNMCDDAVFIGCLRAPAMEDLWNEQHNVRWTQPNCRENILRYTSVDSEQIERMKDREHKLEMQRARTSTLDATTSTVGSSSPYASHRRLHSVKPRETINNIDQMSPVIRNTPSNAFSYTTIKMKNDHENDVRNATPITISNDTNVNIHRVHPDPNDNNTNKGGDGDLNDSSSDQEDELEARLFSHRNSSSRLVSQDLGNSDDDNDESQIERRLCCRRGLPLYESDILLFIGKNSFPQVYKENKIETRRKNDLIDNKLALWKKAADKLRDQNGSHDVLYPQIPSEQIRYSKNEKHVLVIGWRNIWSNDPDRFMNRIMDIADDRTDGSTLTFTNGMSNEQFCNLVKRVQWRRITVPRQISDDDIESEDEIENRRLWLIMNNTFAETANFKIDNDNEIDPNFFNEAGPKHYYSESLRSYVPMFREENTYYYVLPSQYPASALVDLDVPCKKVEGNLFVRHVSSYNTHGDSNNANIQCVLLSPLGITSAIILAEDFEKFDLLSNTKDSRVLDNILLIRKLKKLREKFIDELYYWDYIKEKEKNTNPIDRTSKSLTSISNVYTVKDYPIPPKVFRELENIHIIAENQDDDICDIALPPSSTEIKLSKIIRQKSKFPMKYSTTPNNNETQVKSTSTEDAHFDDNVESQLLKSKIKKNQKIDFINTQGIYARALSMITAYPLIYKGIQDLFDDEETSAAVEIVDPTKFIPPTELYPLHELKILYKDLFKHPIDETIKERLKDMGYNTDTNNINDELNKAIKESNDNKKFETRSIPFSIVRRYCLRVDKSNVKQFYESYYESGKVDNKHAIATSIPLGYLDHDGTVHLLPNNFEYSATKPTELIILRRVDEGNQVTINSETNETYELTQYVTTNSKNTILGSTSPESEASIHL